MHPFLLACVILWFSPVRCGIWEQISDSKPFSYEEDPYPPHRTAASSGVYSPEDMYVFGGAYGLADGAFVFLNDLWIYNMQNDTWSWIAGSTSVNLLPTLEDPGGRAFASSVMDSEGKLWIFGGRRGDGNTNDLYVFYAGTWTHWWGPREVNQYGNYIDKGNATAANSPGSRRGAVIWMDESNEKKLWVFGGAGYGATDSGYLDDLWYFHISSGTWAWMAGDGGIDVYSTVTPSSRSFACSWVTANYVYIFGGQGPAGVFSDLRALNKTSLEWEWLSGITPYENVVGQYGTIGVPSSDHYPGARSGSVCWMNPAEPELLHLFGGVGFGASDLRGYLNDQWTFNLENQQWTWIGGSSIAEGNNPEKRQASDHPSGRSYASAAYVQQKLILFGGQTFISQDNDLWFYSETPTTSTTGTTDSSATESSTTASSTTGGSTTSIGADNSTTAIGATAGQSTTTASVTAELTTGVLTTGVLTTTGVASTTGTTCVPSSSNCFCSIAPIAAATCTNGEWEILSDVSAESQAISIQPNSNLVIHGDFVSLGNISITIASNAELHIHGSMSFSDTDTLSINLNLATSSTEPGQHVTVDSHVHFAGTISIDVPIVIDAEIVLIRFNTSSGDFSNTIITIPPHNAEEECIPASVTTQRRERSYALLLVSAQTGDECDTDSSEESEWLTWAIVVAVILVVVVAVLVGVILFLKSTRKKEKSRIELKARQEANAWQL